MAIQRKRASLRRCLAPLCAALGLSMLWHGPALAADSYKLRFNHVLGAAEPFHKGFLKWSERVAERTKGGLRIDVFHSAQLGVEEDIIEQIRQGANVGQNTDSARLGNYVKGIAVVNGPYLVGSTEQAFKLAEAPTMVAWQKELAEKHGLKVVCFDWVQGFRHFFTNKEVKTPDDLKGLRIRTPPAPIWQESIRALGAQPVALAFGEVYPGLQQQAIDGAELVYPNITAANLNEVLKFANETAHILLVNFQVVSSAWFDALPKDYQTVLVEECRKAGQETSKAIQEAADKARATLEGRGMKVVQVDMEAFRKAGDRAYEVLGLTEAKDRIRAEIGQ